MQLSRFAIPCGPYSYLEKHTLDPCPRRYGSAQVAVQFGGSPPHGALEVLAVALCPIPSRAQHCGGAPRQTPAPAATALLKGDLRVTATDQTTGQQVFGTLHSLRRGLPTHRAYLRPEPGKGQGVNGGSVTGEAFFWTGERAAVDGAGPVAYVVVHSAPWFEPGGVLQAIALHRDDGLPNRSNLVAPLYCNADAPAPPAHTAVLDCGEWPVARARDARPTTVANFSATRAVMPGSIAYQALNPLSGQILLSAAEHQDLQSGQLYVNVYMQSDATAYGRVRGAVVRAQQPSCIGGLVFEYSDEWWKGSKNDLFHADCDGDNASVQSACGHTIPNFGPDSRMNEEWFGLYSATYDARAPHRVTLHPRPAVPALQELWGTRAAVAGPPRAGEALESAAGAPRAPGPVPGLPRASTDVEEASTYSTVFPTSVGTYVTEDRILMALAVLAAVMVGMALVPSLCRLLRASRRAEALESLQDLDLADLVRSHSSVHGLEVCRRALKSGDHRIQDRLRGGALGVKYIASDASAPPSQC